MSSEQTPAILGALALLWADSEGHTGWATRIFAARVDVNSLVLKTA